MVTSDELTACHRCLNDHRPRFGRDEGVSGDALTMIDGSWPVIVKASVKCRKLIGSDHVTKILEKLK